MYCSGYCFNEVKQNQGLAFYVFSETDIELKKSIIRTNNEGFENRNCIYIYFEVLKNRRLPKNVPYRISISNKTLNKINNMFPLNKIQFTFVQNITYKTYN